MKGLLPNHEINGRQMLVFTSVQRQHKFHKDLFKDCFSTYTCMVQKGVNSKMTILLLTKSLVKKTKFLNQ